MRLCNRGGYRRAAAALLLLGGLAGCRSAGPAGGGEGRLDDTPMQAVIERVNRNSTAMNFLLRGGGVGVVGEYPRDGRLIPFDMAGTLLFRRPTNLLLRLDHVGTPAMEIGANEQEWWVWDHLRGRYWWSRHGDVIERTDPLDIPVRPDHLVEVLGLNELPGRTAGPKGPLFWVGPDRYELNFIESDQAGQLFHVKAVDIDRRAPFLVREVLYFRPEGHPEIKAYLSDYAKVEGVTGGAVLAPRKILIKWLSNGSWSELTFASMRLFDRPQVEEKFIKTSPRQRGAADLGERIRLGHPPLPVRPPSIPAVQSRAAPATKP